ncbi:fimbrial protein [Serratia entomophila]|uniref:Fimbrial protein n=1 Tax=Serratia entomophila TaxID=42906 RepID=A0ABY5CX93_9GAMM|nr:fimbrial protein [Serratia entomophila]USV02355.1 fimbrial protein [Serratia entomophila]CAI0749789.1 P pilus assembly protein, pilin FimA [Serratia entomophila]CAI0754699.1 P pilus assembly protein, pilin FimA [Serratia entomophila]CAI0767949.1 P pilus assembly protein, pilin FimA [Serratia entomophila]CAI0932643.1 P pilus assembly protein, pilin FimA [Serratia entomophila]
MKLNTFGRNTLLSVLGLAALAMAQQAAAMQCRFGNSTGSKNPTGSVTQDIDVGRPIVLAASDFVAGNLIWRSQNFTSTFTCWDTDNFPRGEHAYIYWNPQNSFGALDKSLAIGVSINGIDYDAINLKQSGKNPTGPDLGPGTKPGSNKKKADPQAVTASYSVYIKATGVKPPAGNFTPLGRASLFQIDGVGGLNATKDSNFNAYIKGLDKIRVIQCNPQITVLANNGASVDFGVLSTTSAKTGTVAKQVPFDIKASLSGGECAGQSLQASFSSTNADPSDNTQILPTTKPGVAIFLTQQRDTNKKPIPLQTNVDFGGTLQDKQNEVKETFIANLKWLTNSPTPGVFNATANVDVTFK